MYRGFESWREVMEAKTSENIHDGSKLKFGSMYVTKGLGRLSIILFGIVWTYCKLRDAMSDEMQTDFRRRCPRI